MRLRPLLRRALWSGGLGSLASTAALVAAAVGEGKAPLRPTNATSHWLNGPEAAEVGRLDGRHTAVGYATHHAATVFWAVLFELWVRHRRRPAAFVGGGLAVSALAAVVDYRATPARFTPGWELVLGRRAMTAAYVAMAVGLAIGAASRTAKPMRR